MGSPKALLDFRGETFLDRLIRIFSEVCEPVVVVVGSEADKVRSGAKLGGRAIFAENADYHLGQLSSMQCGLRAMPENIDGVLFTLVDHPRVRPSTLAALLAPPRPLLAIPRFRLAAAILFTSARRWPPSSCPSRRIRKPRWSCPAISRAPAGWMWTTLASSTT
jgi:Uncharacterized MobA-related protein